jgi:hypothetical protein
VLTTKKTRKGEEPDDDDKNDISLSDQPQPLDPKLLRYRLQMLAWIRVGLGIAAGVLSGTLGTYYVNSNPITFNPNSYVGLYIGILVYIGSYYLGKYRLGIVLPQKDKNKLITQGIGGYIMMFLFFWILYNTLCFSVGCFSFHLF